MGKSSGGVDAHRSLHMLAAHRARAASPCAVIACDHVSTRDENLVDDTVEANLAFELFVHTVSGDWHSIRRGSQLGRTGRTCTDARGFTYMLRAVVRIAWVPHGVLRV